MNPSCSTRHPSEAPALLRVEKGDDVCILCVLGTVVHGGIVCAARQAALSSLQCICHDSAQLSSLGSATISRIHSRLLSSLLSVSPPPPAPLAPQLTQFVCTLSFAADSTLQLHAPSTATSFVAAAINASVSVIHNRPCAVALSLLATIVSSAKSAPGSPSHAMNTSDAIVRRYLFAALGRNAMAFARALLKTSPDVTTWPSTACVLNATIRAAPLAISSEKIIPLIPVPPTLRAHTASTTAYLSVISTIIDVHSSNAADVLLNAAEDFVSVVRHALLSTDSGLSTIAANVVTLLSRLSPVVANGLVQNGIFEYLVETLRTTNQSSSTLSESLPISLLALAAIASQCPDALVPKWPYALSVIMACCDTIPLDTTPSLLAILRPAFENAAVPVFSATIVQQMVSLVLRVFNQNRSVSSVDVPAHGRSLFHDVLDCLLTLLSRYQINIDTIHTVLSVSEICSTDTGSITAGLRLLRVCASRFCDLVEKQKDISVFNDEEGKRLQRRRKSALVSLGKRLIFILLDIFGLSLFSKLDTLEIAMSFLGGVDGIVSVMCTFTVIMHSAFIDIGCVSAAEHSDIRQAFWNTLPLRVAYASVREDPDADKECHLKAYITCLLADPILRDSGRSSPETNSPEIPASFPLSSADFLKQLAEDVAPLQSSVSFQMVQRGLSFENIQALCETGAIVHGLSKRMVNTVRFGENVTMHLSQRWQDHLLRTLLSVSSICRMSNMVFPVDCLSEDIVTVFVNGCEDLSQEDSFNIACEVLCLKRLEDLHHFVWEKLSESLSFCHTVKANERKSSLYVMCETTEVVLHGVVNAVIHSAVPQRIATLVSCIYLHGKNQVSNLKGVSKRDVIQRAEQQLTRIRTVWEGNNEPGQLMKRTCKNAFDMECLRTSAILEVLVRTDATSDTAASWSLLRTLTELLALIGTALTLDHGLAALHASMLHCVVQMVCKTRDPKRLVYVIETGGVLKHCTQVLKSVPDANVKVWELQRNEYILLHVGHFMLAMMQNENEPIQSVSENAILSELTSNSEVWECALADHMERHEVVTALRIACYSDLLQKVYTTAKMSWKSARRTSFVSSYVLTLTCVSCVSPRDFVSDVNYFLLSTVLESDERTVDLIPEDVFYVLSEITMSKLCSLNKQLASANELNCSAQLVMLGKVDRHLPDLHDSLYDTWKDWTKLLTESNSTSADSRKKPVPLSSLARLLLATKNRICTIRSKTEAPVKIKSVSQKELKKMESESKGCDREVPAMLPHPQIYYTQNSYIAATKPS